jgi:hypothetical protein
MAATSSTVPYAAVPTTADKPTKGDPIVVTRRRLDFALVGIGVIAVLVLAVSAGLLTWGSGFSRNYVRDELGSQHISFGTAEALQAEGRQDLVKYAGSTLDSGQEAQAYASYINGHLQKIGGGKTFADLGAPEGAAKDAVKAAVTAKQPQTNIDALQAKADAIGQTRNTMFKGETLRGLLLSAYAWSTVGRIAGLAAIGAIVAAGVMAIFVLLGINHLVSHRAKPA